MTNEGARRTLEWVEEHLECVGGPCKETYIAGLKAVDELLKDQEPIPCGEKIKAGEVMLDFYECGYCKNAIRRPWKHCPFCGKAVKWDE